MNHMLYICCPLLKLSGSESSAKTYATTQVYCREINNKYN